MATFLWFAEIRDDGVLDVADEDLSPWAGKTGTFYVTIFNTGDANAVAVWDLLKVSFR